MKPEARLERELLLAIGRNPTVALYKNPVGEGYYGNIRPQIRDALKRLGPSPFHAVDQILQRSHVTYGLGVGSPDLVGMGIGKCPHCSEAVPGMFAGLELKSERGRVRVGQAEWHEAAASRGALIAAVRNIL